ncbi:transcriptional regulator, IclR family protein, partial [Arthrobacter sp. Hiyo6]
MLPTNQAATMTRHLPVLRGIAGQIERATARIPL